MDNETLRMIEDLLNFFRNSTNGAQLKIEIGEKCFLILRDDFYNRLLQQKYYPERE